VGRRAAAPLHPEGDGQGSASRPRGRNGSGADACRCCAPRARSSGAVPAVRPQPRARAERLSLWVLGAVHGAGLGERDGPLLTVGDRPGGAVDQTGGSLRIRTEVPGAAVSPSPAHVPRGTAWRGSEPTTVSAGGVCCALPFFCCWVGKEIITSSCFLFKLGSNTLQQVEEVADCRRQSPASRDRWNLLAFLSRGSSANPGHLHSSSAGSCRSSGAGPGGSLREGRVAHSPEQPLRCVCGTAGLTPKPRMISPRYPQSVSAGSSRGSAPGLGAGHPWERGARGAASCGSSGAAATAPGLSRAGQKLPAPVPSSLVWDMLFFGGRDLQISTALQASGGTRGALAGGVSQEGCGMGASLAIPAFFHTGGLILLCPPLEATWPERWCSRGAAVLTRCCRAHTVLPCRRAAAGAAGRGGSAGLVVGPLVSGARAPARARGLGEAAGVCSVPGAVPAARAVRAAGGGLQGPGQAALAAGTRLPVFQARTVRGSLL